MCAVPLRATGASATRFPRHAASGGREGEVRHARLRACATGDARVDGRQPAGAAVAEGGPAARQSAQRQHDGARPVAVGRRRRAGLRHLHSRRQLRAAAVVGTLLQRARLPVGAGRRERQLLAPAHPVRHLSAAGRQHAPAGDAAPALARHRVRPARAADGAPASHHDRLPVRQGDPEGTAAERRRRRLLADTLHQGRAPPLHQANLRRVVGAAAGTGAVRLQRQAVQRLRPERHSAARRRQQSDRPEPHGAVRRRVQLRVPPHRRALVSHRQSRYRRNALHLRPARSLRAGRLGRRAGPTLRERRDAARDIHRHLPVLPRRQVSEQEFDDVSVSSARRDNVC